MRERPGLRYVTVDGSRMIDLGEGLLADPLDYERAQRDPEAWAAFVRWARKAELRAGAVVRCRHCLVGVRLDAVDGPPRCATCDARWDAETVPHAGEDGSS